MEDLIAKYWTHLSAIAVAIFTVFVYCFDKIHAYLSDKKKKNQTYNRVFVAAVKLFYSYQKHKKLYEETPSINLSDEIYAFISKQLDSFEKDLESFKNTILKESEIIPEILIESHLLFENADRINIIDRINFESDIPLLSIKRAQYHAIESIFDDLFESIIKKTGKLATIKQKFINNLLNYGNGDNKIETIKQNQKIMKKYIESLHRQKLITDKELKHIFRDLTRVGREKDGSIKS
ncbi:hypothetical protein [Flavobacterium lindanitolerans]|uniref:hypothetical protein n=1 Tax=Flavobacterium lindanitolerans TaxID=428988 RepID=UPI0031DE0122